MNWTSLLRYRKQVEDVIREEVMFAELEKSREESKTQKLRNEIDHLAISLDRSLQSGVDTIFAEQRYRWLDETGGLLEMQAMKMQEIDGKLVGLRKRLQAAHHARRVVEIVIEKKEAAYMKKLEKQEQAMMEEATAHKHAITSREGFA
ncbi:flagellar FliJ family protein [Nitrospira sp. M1]